MRFKKFPYGQRHKVSTFYNFRTNGGQLKYSGEWNRAVGEWGIVFNAQGQTDRFTRNYFGFGNESSEDIEENEYNRVRQSYVGADLSLRRNLSLSSTLDLGFNGDYVKISQTPDRFVSLPF